MILQDDSTIDQDEIDGIRESFKEAVERINEIKEFFRASLTSSSYDHFKYRCLGHLEPGLFEETEWVTQYSSITSMEEFINQIAEEVDLSMDPEEHE